MRTAAITANDGDTDYTYRYVPNLVWFLVEMYVGIICACLPCLKPFTKRYFPNFSIFSSRLESRLSTSIHIASARVQNLTSGLGVSASRGAVERERGQQTRSMSRIGADILQSKPSHSSMFNGHGHGQVATGSGAVDEERGGSSEETCSTCNGKDFHGGGGGAHGEGGGGGIGEAILGEKSSASTLRGGIKVEEEIIAVSEKGPV